MLETEPEAGSLGGYESRSSLLSRRGGHGDGKIHQEARLFVCVCRHAGPWAAGGGRAVDRLESRRGTGGDDARLAGSDGGVWVADVSFTGRGAPTFCQGD